MAVPCLHLRDDVMMFSLSQVSENRLTRMVNLCVEMLSREKMKKAHLHDDVLRR